MEVMSSLKHIVPRLDNILCRCTPSSTVVMHSSSFSLGILLTQANAFRFASWISPQYYSNFGIFMAYHALLEKNSQMYHLFLNIMTHTHMFPIFEIVSLRSRSFITLRIYCLMCQMSYTWVNPLPWHPFNELLYALLIDSCMLEIMQTSCPGVTCLLGFFIKKKLGSLSYHLSPVQRRLELSSCSHIVQLLSTMSLCNCRTTTFH